MVREDSLGGRSETTGVRFVKQVGSERERGSYCLPNHIFGIDKARHFKFRVLINTQEY